MPRKAHEIVKALKRKGYSEESAWKIANSKVSKDDDKPKKHKRGKR